MLPAVIDPSGALCFQGTPPAPGQHSSEAPGLWSPSNRDFAVAGAEGACGAPLSPGDLDLWTCRMSAEDPPRAGAGDRRGTKLSLSSTLSLSTRLGHGIGEGVAVGGGRGEEQRSRTWSQDVSPAVKLLGIPYSSRHHHWARHLTPSHAHRYPLSHARRPSCSVPSR